MKVLVIAPHPDDETLGCGGTLLKHKKDGDEIHWMIITKNDNDKNFSINREKEIESVFRKYKFEKNVQPWFSIN